MTLGEGIFWSTVLILVTFFLYQVSVKKKWKTVGKVFTILVLVGALIGGGFWGWNVYELRPQIMGELDGVRLGMSPVEVKLVKGAPTTEGEVVEQETVDSKSDLLQPAQKKKWSIAQQQAIDATRAMMKRDKDNEAFNSNTKDDGEKFRMYWEYKKSDYSDEYLMIKFFGDEQNALRTSFICKRGGYSKIFGLGKYTSEETVIKKLGTPSHESISSDGLRKMISYEQWKVAFEIEKDNVISWCVTDSGRITYVNEYGEESAMDTPNGLTEAEELELELLEAQARRERERTPAKKPLEPVQ